jgi:D-arabinose 1-dehydrogenase-like Zn-dependent alcohol dehydrogenase
LRWSSRFRASVRGEVSEKDLVAVLGYAAIGLRAIEAAAWWKAKVIGVDIDDGKLLIARRAGAHEVINLCKRTCMRNSPIDCRRAGCRH